MKRISNKFITPKGKGLFVFSDPGGAKPILSLISLMKIKEAQIVSDRYHDFYNWFKIKVNVIENAEDIVPIIEKYKPNYTFTGTSYLSTIEKLTLRVSKINKIPSYTYLDQDSNLHLRFYSNSELFYPTYIYYPENISISKESEEFLKVKSKLYPIKNYFHYFLNEWQSKIDKGTFIEGILDYNRSKEILTIALDPISNLSLSHYDEFLLLDEILNTIQNSYWKDSIVIIKPHPNQRNIKKIHSILIQYPKLNWKIWNTPKYDLELLYYSDILIGLYSSIILEAAEFGTPIIRYIPFKLEKDPLGFHKSIITKDSEELRIHLNEIRQ